MGYCSCPKLFNTLVIPLLRYSKNTLGSITYILTRGGVLRNPTRKHMHNGSYWAHMFQNTVRCMTACISFVRCPYPARTFQDTVCCIIACLSFVRCPEDEKERGKWRRNGEDWWRNWEDWKKMKRKDSNMRLRGPWEFGVMNLIGLDGFFFP